MCVLFPVATLIYMLQKTVRVCIPSIQDTLSSLNIPTELFMSERGPVTYLDKCRVVVDWPGAVCIWMLILLPEEGLP